MMPQQDSRTAVVYDEDGRRLSRVGGTSNHNIVTLKPERVNTVWRLSLEGSGPFRFHIDHVPTLLAFDANTARKIRGSVIEIGDTMLHHEFQRQLWHTIHRFKPTDFEVPAAVLDAARLLETPRKSAIALGTYGPLSVLPNILDRQNLAPNDHWFGSIHNWQEFSGRKSPANRWDRDYPTFQAVGRGLHASMARLYSRKFPGNPYYKHPGLLNRTVIAAAIHLLRMTEEEIFNEFEYDKRKRCRLHYHFDYPEAGTLPFHLVADDLPPPTHRAILNGLRRQAELLRYYHTGATNQWVIMLHGYWHMYKITGEEHSRDLVTRHLKSIENDEADEYVGQAPAGYYRENKGFDGAYNSASTFGIGALYAETSDPVALRCVHFSAPSFCAAT